MFFPFNSLCLWVLYVDIWHKSIYQCFPICLCTWLIKQVSPSCSFNNTAEFFSNVPLWVKWRSVYGKPAWWAWLLAAPLINYIIWNTLHNFCVCFFIFKEDTITVLPQGAIMRVGIRKLLKCMWLAHKKDLVNSNDFFSSKFLIRKAFEI